MELFALDPGTMVGSRGTMKWLGLLLLVAACEHGKGGGVFNPDGGSGSTCGGFGGVQCAADEWCDFAANDCGGADNTGTCKPRPRTCDDNFDPVCGCDGTVHANACEAEALGVDVSAIGSCPPEAGFFTCGPKQCEIDAEFCQRSVSDIGGEPDSFGCGQLPVGCGATPSCDCLANEACGFNCSGDAVGGFTLTCPGG
jgi:hypothetical protein